uniref:hypothetical protein n=1 Tax=Herbidospora sakaeratensis TaxID=564415 RepID=UPI000B13D847|nr:hypothetical protein [Herbidospora sakaeratensis]
MRTKITVCLVSGLAGALNAARLSSSFQQVVSGAFLAAVVVTHRVPGGVREDDAPV